MTAEGRPNNLLISVIIPTWNEIGLVGKALETLLQQQGDFEVIVVDGGSTDGTCEVVEKFPVQLVRQPDAIPPGLGSQINRGAEKARGSILMFLHIDVRLPRGGIAQVTSALDDPTMVGGGFLPRYDCPVRPLRGLTLELVERSWQSQTRLWHWFAGDTAPFIRTAAFWHAGGYPPARFASDWDFAQQLQRLGRLAIIQAPVEVDCRRLVQNGVLKTYVMTALIGLLYYMQVDRAQLSKLYRTCLPRER